MGELPLALPDSVAALRVTRDVAGLAPAKPRSAFSVAGEFGQRLLIGIVAGEEPRCQVRTGPARVILMPTRVARGPVVRDSCDLGSLLVIPEDC